MTPQVRDFVARHRDKLFGRVLEVGSYNVNGSVREIIDIEMGVDIRRGPGVDLVCSVSDLFDHVERGVFDACVSTESLEHVEDWRAFVRNTWEAVRPDGWILVTMASPNNGRHDYPHDYWRLSREHVFSIWPGAQDFSELGKVSIGWIVQKSGNLGRLDDIEPMMVP